VTPGDHAASHRLLNDRVEDLLVDRRVGKAPAPVPRERRGIGNPVSQPETRELPVRHIDLHLAHELALAAHPEQVADEQQFEHHHRVQRGPPVVRAVQVRHLLADELVICVKRIASYSAWPWHA
jgi:hypothetical protein